jgi:hypothetical protein
LSVDAVACAKSQTASTALAAADRAASPLSAFHFGGTAGGSRAFEARDRFHCWRGHWITGGLVTVFAYAINLFVTHWLYVVVKPKLLTLLWFARAWASLSRSAIERGAGSRVVPARWLDDAPLGDKACEKFLGRHVFDTVISKIPWTGDWGRFNENGRALPRHGRRMHQMGERGVYGRSARVVSAARANLA